jgi:hypothetical protein
MFNVFSGPSHTLKIVCSPNRKRGFFESTSSVVINLYPNPSPKLDYPTNLMATGVVEEAAAAVVEEEAAAAELEEVEEVLEVTAVENPGIGHGRTRTRPDMPIITGKGDTTKRWLGLVVGLPRSYYIHI